MVRSPNGSEAADVVSSAPNEDRPPGRRRTRRASRPSTPQDRARCRPGVRSSCRRCNGRIHRERRDRIGGARVDAPGAGPAGVPAGVTRRRRFEPKRGDHRPEQQPAAVPGLDQERVLAHEAEPRPHRVLTLENRRGIDAGSKGRRGMVGRQRPRELDESTLQDLVVVAASGVPGDPAADGTVGIDPVPASIVVSIRDDDHRGRPRQVDTRVEPLLEPSLHPLHRSMAARRDPGSNLVGVTGGRRVTDPRKREFEISARLEHHPRHIDGVAPRPVGFPLHRRPTQRASRPGGTSGTRPPDPVIEAAAA